ncbi:ABC transporter permease [Pelagibaculum spongiae]|uniref:ABC transporter permease n=1 Tax=Pelagibaculum spongiae TaxID=2080658 RepID=A0A2V1H076_9GAMM|nr:ABC transporter permease [Pelagibaculum spongiae]PVZ69011.1 ABC transporter permease [Pelagibaculum spongiae]
MDKLFDSMLIRGLTSLLMLGAFWQGAVIYFEVPGYLLPQPVKVIQLLWQKPQLFLNHGWVTLTEIILGLMLGIFSGGLLALQLHLFSSLRRWLLPLLIASQAVPVFAIAPLLMLWLGYGIASKVVMSAIIIFFPIATCCYDGLRQTPQGFLDLAQTMQASQLKQLLHIRLPAALPSLASGIRIAVVIAPIGAVVGEWVGSSEGLGYLMIQANARMQITELFAALLVLASMAVSLYYLSDYLLKKMIPWQPEN